MYGRIITTDARQEENVTVFVVDRNGKIISAESKATSVRDMKLTANEMTELLSKEMGVMLAKNGTYYAHAPIDGVGWTLLPVCRTMPSCNPPTT